MIDELVRELHDVRDMAERLLEIEERGLRAYEEALERLRSRPVLEALLVVALETIIHAHLLRGLADALTAAIRVARRAQARPLVGGYEDVQRYYGALRSHLELEKEMVVAARRVAEELRRLEEEHRGEGVETLYRFLAAVVEALARNEAEHTAKLGEILSLARG